MLNAVHGHPNVLECLGEDMLEPDQVPPPSEKGHNHGRRCLKLPCLKPRGVLFHIAFPGPLGIADVQGFARQMVAGVEHIHLCGVAHLDIKPNNMLVDANGTLKISDFGLARPIARPEIAESAEGSGPSAMTQYVVTRWYRAPEILLLVSTYTTAVDLWSAGCILAELLLRRPLFRGASHVGQLQARHVSVGRSLMPRVGRTVPYLIPVCIRRRSSVCSARRRTPTSRISTPS